MVGCPHKYKVKKSSFIGTQGSGEYTYLECIYCGHTEGITKSEEEKA